MSNGDSIMSGLLCPSGHPLVSNKKGKTKTRLGEGAELDLRLTPAAATAAEAPGSGKEAQGTLPTGARARTDLALDTRPWSEAETDKFYDALKMFGTDFMIIAQMFQPKTRRQMKLKFSREEKLDPTRVHNALLGKDARPIDLEHYASESGCDVSVFTKYESFEDAERVIRESVRDKEAAMRAVVAEEENMQRN